MITDQTLQEFEEAGAKLGTAFTKIKLAATKYGEKSRAASIALSEQAAASVDLKAGIEEFQAAEIARRAAYDALLQDDSQPDEPVNELVSADT